MVIAGQFAGGPTLSSKPKEGAEDLSELGVADLKFIEFSDKDVVVGIAASGRTPYVIGALNTLTTLSDYSCFVM